MREIDLREYVRSDPVRLSVAERDGLNAIVPSLTIEPVAGAEGRYHLTPGSVVGALESNGLSVSIRPKLDIVRVLFLASYAMGAFKLRDMERFDFAHERNLVEAMALALATAARRAFAGGLVHGYRTEEEAAHTVRGRIRIDEQIRRRFGAAVPVEVRYDEFTDDVTANRLVKAAAARLGRLRLSTKRSRDGLHWIAATLDNVSLEEFPATAVPEVTFDRLNEHYREVVALARLVLRHGSFEAHRGGVRAQAFLINMNEVFQHFVTRALREELRLSPRVFRSDSTIERTFLDEGNRIRLKPDLSWWESGACTFVGDAKYKRIVDTRVPNADLYQLLAYAVALDLPGGMLIYAQGEAEPATHRVRHAGKRLQVAAVDLSGSPAELLGGIKALAKRVRAIRVEAGRMSPAA
ncbi:MAG: restriction endonuclease [Gammaproteobacteria bacterium]|nr:restriction endonuclease [Gammaproteobacteria bacterium]